MKNILLLITIVLTVGTNAHASELVILDFKLMEAHTVVNFGTVNVTSQSKSWSKGLNRSFLKLRCKLLPSGKTEKNLSTIDHFSGLIVTHKLNGDQLELVVTRHQVKPRLVEIRAQPKNECADLTPIITTITEFYSVPSINGSSASKVFGSSMKFNMSLKSL